MNKKEKIKINWTALLVIIAVTFLLYFWYNSSPASYDGMMKSIGLTQQEESSVKNE